MKRIHMMGIGGSGMSGVAHLAEKMGYIVTGCDIEENTAYAKDIYLGHSPDHLKDIDLLIVSPAILFQNSGNAELVEAQKRKIVMTWQEFLGKELLKNKKLICVAGTHGKSTTTSMIGKVLIDAGLDPIIVLGANVSEWGGSSRYGKGEYAVVEADEFNNNFLHYHPEIIVINNIEFDHPDFFKDEDEVKKSFRKFTQNLKGDKILITSEDSPHKHFNLKVFGEHNQKNANMVFLLGKALGIDEAIIIKSIESFTGIGRRMELIADKNGVKIYDDYAHHPTAIKTTLEGLREKYPKEKILAIVEPHGYKRTKALLAEYKGVFDSVDKVFIGPIFKARDEVDESITPQLVAKTSNHPNIDTFKNFEHFIKNFKFQIDSIAPRANFDVIVVMGAGKSYLWAREIVKMIEQTQTLKRVQGDVVEQEVCFEDLTTFKIGGKINKYFEVSTQKKIDEALDYAKENHLEVFIIGGGSDILVSDKDFNGVVIKFIGDDIKQKGENVKAKAGMSWDKLVEYAVKNNLQGIECMSGIPGTVGASPIQNIGAYGQEIADTFVSLTVYDIEKRKFVNFSKEDCKFGYRESVFKRKSHWQKYIITEVTFKLNKDVESSVNYDSLKGYIKDNPSLMDVRNAILEVRNEKLEDPRKIGNAGSFFKAPIIDVKQKKDLEIMYPDIKIFPFADKFKVPAGWLIEKTGWKGKTYKGAGVSSKHALILINVNGEAKADDVFELSELIIGDVNKKFGIKLEREVQLINF